MTSLVNACIQWFTEYSEKKTYHSELANQYASRLTEVSSIKELRNQLNIYQNVSGRLTLFASNPFAFKLQEWQVHLNDIDKKYSKVMSNQIGQDWDAASSWPDEIVLLLTFIDGLLNEPNILLHPKILSVLTILEKPKEFRPVMIYLRDRINGKEDHTVQKEKPRQNSFSNLKPDSEAHKACIELLDLNSEGYDEKNPLCRQANILLQSLLAMNKEIRQSDFLPPKESQDHHPGQGINP